jgi:hypothetical protein
MMASLVFLAALLSVAGGSEARRTITTEQFLQASDPAKPVSLTINTRNRQNQTAP